MSLATGRASELPSARRRQAGKMPALGVKVADDVDVEERTGQHNAGHGNILEEYEPGRLRGAGPGITDPLVGARKRDGRLIMLVTGTCSMPDRSLPA